MAIRKVTPVIDPQQGQEKQLKLFEEIEVDQRFLSSSNGNSAFCDPPLPATKHYLFIDGSHGLLDSPAILSEML